MFTILLLLIHEHCIFHLLFVSSLISFISVLSFSMYRSFVSLGKFLFLSILFFSLQCNDEWDYFLNFSFCFLIVSVEECKGFLYVNFISCNFTTFID